MYGDVAAMETLIEAGADVNAPYPYETTVLMTAVWVEELDAIIALLETGADANKRDIDGLTALDHAKEMGTLEDTEAYQRLLWATR